MYNLHQFRGLIIRILEDQGLCSRAAVNLLLGTSAKESDFGTYLRQMEGGPALGAFQMEPATTLDIWKNYLYLGRAKRRAAIYEISGVRSHRDNGAMEWNLAYQICMGRLHYRRIAEPFPNSNDVEGLGRYWDIHWNRNPAKGTVKEFVEKWDQFIGKEVLNL